MKHSKNLIVKYQAKSTFRLIDINHIKKFNEFQGNETCNLSIFINHSSILNQSIGNLDILLRDVKVDKIQN